MRGADAISQAKYWWKEGSMSRLQEALICGGLFVIMLAFGAGKYELGSQSKYSRPSHSKAPSGQEVISIPSCKDNGFTTVAKFEMRGNDQILVLSCGTEKIPND
jgi:hypothetical protein